MICRKEKLERDTETTSTLYSYSYLMGHSKQNNNASEKLKTIPTMTENDSAPASRRGFGEDPLVLGVIRNFCKRKL
jgi:hypothetical protein